MLHWLRQQLPRKRTFNEIDRKLSFGDLRPNGNDPNDQWQLQSTHILWLNGVRLFMMTKIMFPLVELVLQFIGRFFMD